MTLLIGALKFAGGLLAEPAFDIAELKTHPVAPKFDAGDRARARPFVDRMDVYADHLCDLVCRQPFIQNERVRHSGSLWGANTNR